MSKLSPTAKRALALRASADQLDARIAEVFGDMNDSDLNELNAQIALRTRACQYFGDSVGLFILEIANLKLSEHLLAQESTDAA